MKSTLEFRHTFPDNSEQKIVPLSGFDDTDPILRKNDTVFIARAAID